MSLLGNEAKAGQTVFDFKVQKSVDRSDYTLAGGAGKTRIIATVSSLDRRCVIWERKDSMKRRTKSLTPR